MRILSEQETPREMVMKGRDLSVGFIFGHALH